MNQTPIQGLSRRRVAVVIILLVTGQAAIALFTLLSIESVEISEGVVLDYDDKDKFTGIDTDNASHKIDLNEITLSQIPVQQQLITA